MLLIIHTNPAHMGDFLLAHLNKTHLCIHKVPKKFRFLFKYKRSRGRGGGGYVTGGLRHNCWNIFLGYNSSVNFIDYLNKTWQQ